MARTLPRPIQNARAVSSRHVVTMRLVRRADRSGFSPAQSLARLLLPGPLRRGGRGCLSVADLVQTFNLRPIVFPFLSSSPTGP
jgi:hypothetical protein